MTKIFNISNHKDKRRELRFNMPKAEAVLWKHISRKQVLGYRFLRQFSISSYVLDFYCPKLRLAIEIDGSTHIKDEEIEYDRNRQREIEQLGIQFLRFKNEEVLFDLSGVISKIEMSVKNLEEPP
jgi:very-short-patch-repair endonuclease